ncbi:hypothetical protein E6C76_04905 [Pseudothauera nasutitermitis]|uniref:Uncharacterized protein n=1 Tax=Pseudothauera nasutitermitis TaxID=2565930 RepID=A0A4S4B383_9RHOO|nr:hypothetical protein [Pseudothauera nasutitermitis]THF66200.1 hypothetical protein E6C76_04905 [Pseudothauera nasutitermitis]
MNTASGRPTETDTRALYERFPHLRQIDLMWGSKECRQFIFRLMTDTRGGARQGFPPEHAMTIMSLLLEHDRNYPEFEYDANAAWGSDPTRRGGGRY